MEYLVVKFSEPRGVIINDAAGSWMTNEILQLQPGTYVVRLAEPQDFSPPQIKVKLRNTAVNVTKTVVFVKTA